MDTLDLQEYKISHRKIWSFEGSSEVQKEKTKIKRSFKKHGVHKYNLHIMQMIKIGKKGGNHNNTVLRRKSLSEFVFNSNLRL